MGTPATKCFIYLHRFLSSGLGASISHFIGRSVCRSVCLSVCQKSVKNMSKTVKKDVSRLLRCLQVYRSTLLAYDKLFRRWKLTVHDLVLCVNTIGILDHTYLELSVARATLVKFRFLVLLSIQKPITLLGKNFNEM